MTGIRPSLIAASRRRFNPLSLSPALWLDASDSSTLFDATSGGSLVAADGGVARIEDKSGNFRHFTQSSSTSRPLRRVSVQNGRDAVEFDGSNDIMFMSAGLDIFQNVPGITWLAVVKWLTEPTTTRIFASAATNNNSIARSLIGAGAVSKKTRFQSRRNDGDTPFAQAGTNDVPATFYIQVAVMDYQNQTMRQWVGSTQNASDTSVLTSGNTSNTNSTNVAIGAFHTETAPSNIQIAELFAFSRALTDSERELLANYAVSKYNIALA